MWSLWTEVLHEIRSNWSKGEGGLVYGIRQGSLWKVDRCWEDRASECGEWVIGEAYHTIGWDHRGTTHLLSDRIALGTHHTHPDSGQCVINIGQVSSKYWSLCKGKHVVFLTDEGLMILANAAKKLPFPTAGVFSRLSPRGPGCPLGGSYYQTQSHHSSLLTNADCWKESSKSTKNRVTAQGIL